MLIVAEHYAGSDTGRQRRANEDSLLVALTAVRRRGRDGRRAGGRGGLANRRRGLPGRAAGSADEPERELAELAQQANSRIHELSHVNAEHAGMGTTLTAVYVGESEVAIAHVGDSRAYCLRDGELIKLTDDHSLVDELMRQGRLTPEEAVEHPQRSVITRALGPEGTVEVDTRSFRARDGDVYLLCSDGLTTMLPEERIAALLNERGSLRDAGEALIAAANEAGGRDNITVLLLRVEDAGAGGHPLVDEHVTMTGVPAVRIEQPRAAEQTPASEARVPRQPRTGPARAGSTAACAAPSRSRQHWSCSG